MEWFKKLPKQFYNNNKINLKYENGHYSTITFEDVIEQLLLEINDTIVQTLGDSPGTTFSAAITRNENGRDTVKSISIGDSKILKISSDGKVVQLSKDDNILAEGIASGELYLKDSDSETIYTSNPKYESVDVVYEKRKNSNDERILNEADTRFYKRNNIISGYLGSGQTRDELKNKLKNKKEFITEWYFNDGDKILLCTDGIADNLSNIELGSLMYTLKDSRECLKRIIDIGYKIEEQKIQKGRNNPPAKLENNSNFTNKLKGSRDNSSAVIIEKNDKGGER